MMQSGWASLSAALGSPGVGQRNRGFAGSRAELLWMSEPRGCWAGEQSDRTCPQRALP